MARLNVLTWSRQQVTTFLTIVIVGLWVVTAVVRIWVEFPAGYVLDSAMPLVIGYYFVSAATAKKNGSEAPA